MARNPSYAPLVATLGDGRRARSQYERFGLTSGRYWRGGFLAGWKGQPGGIGTRPGHFGSLGPGYGGPRVGQMFHLGT
jgi:hypothetical protein